MFIILFKKSMKQPDSTLKIALKDRYFKFQQLLAKNNYVLELMADMEEKLSGEYLFDKYYIKTKVRLIADGVLDIIKNLNYLSKDKYLELYKIYDVINEEIEKILSFKIEIPVCDLTIPLKNLSCEMVNIAGGKMAQLGEIKNRLGLPTPDGFTISAYAFCQFMEFNVFTEKINKTLLSLSSLSIENMEEVNRVSKEIQKMIIESDIPYDLEKAIKDSYAILCDKLGRETKVAVRSSAILENGKYSFAGQYATFLNVPGDLILQKYKEVVASLFTPRAIFYYKTKGFSEGEMVMAVGVLNMIDAKAGGVIYTRDPNNPEADYLVINAVYGLGKLVVDGAVTTDSYIVSRQLEKNILNKSISNQKKMLMCRIDGRLEEVAIPDEMKGKQCITDEQIFLLTKYALDIEKHYGCPQDIEWAIGSDNLPYILQTRPLRVFIQPSALDITIPTRIKGYNVLLDKGIIACKGIGHGRAFLLKDEESLKDFPDGAVLVAKHTSPKFVIVMNKASAIITDVGSATGHMASLSREYQVPTILDTEVSTRIIRDGQEITVDAINCNIYEGKVNELLEYAFKKKEPFKDTHLFKTLEKVLKNITPLNLVDPYDDNFKPEYCRTFHDITRFAHEIAMQEMFEIGKMRDVKETKTIVLKAEIPVDVHMLDIDGGIRENIKKKAFPEDILSIPFSALLKGMCSMKWPGPKPQVKGFLGTIANATSIEAKLFELGEKSFAILSKNYMNFSIRLGYHFSLIEAYAGDNLNDNYIKFFFKGGGASQDRRLRRVGLIIKILKKIGFRINAKEDLIDAVLTKYKRTTIEEMLILLGKLTAYTKQLDMVMFNDAIADIYTEDFIKEHIAGKV
ncbi:MAG: phosphoenolpyruvate synthase [Nitrospirae bacterium]|nr:phosphoenolpyruvate synthase [Nitrospirota bacterium]